MNKEELLQILIKANVSKDLYNINGGLPNEAFCLNQEGDLWEVYYSERGVKSEIERFPSEEEACSYFYKKVIEQIPAP